MTHDSRLTTDLYREEILDHAKNPRNWGKLKNPSFEIKETNPLCGDEVILGILLEGRPPALVEKVMFEAKGCAISIASSSMLTEKIMGKTKAEMKKINEKEILSWFSAKGGSASGRGGSLTSSRKECALLPLKALRGMLKGSE